ncbi:MAG: IS3 family transposase, partial [Culicoidibacterales bacterium]
GGVLFCELSKAVIVDTIEQWSEEFGLNWLCKKFGIAKSSYYSRIETRNAKRDEQEKLDFHVYETYHKPSKNKISGTDGYRMIYNELLDQNIFKRDELNAHHVLLAMRRLGIRSITQKRKTKPNPGEYCESFPDLVEGKFIRKSPNTVWFTDFTYVRVGSVFYYICVIMDGCDGDIIAMQVSKHIDANLACDTLRQAMAKAKPTQTVILHSDQGSQYRSKKFTTLCKQKNIQQSMSRAGTPTDNASMESFIGKMKNERLKHVEINSLIQLDHEARIFCTYHNNEKLHSRHGYMTLKEVKQRRLERAG